jgi:hypothetical protein
VLKLVVRKLPIDVKVCRHYPWPRRALHTSRVAALRINFLPAYEPKPRISNLTMASHADGNPSGVVPGVVDGALRSCQGQGREEGPDCVFKFVFLAKVEDYFVFSILMRFLYVKLPTD